MAATAPPTIQDRAHRQSASPRIATTMQQILLAMLTNFCDNGTIMV
jgi:hypothetical protein